MHGGWEHTAAGGEASLTSHQQQQHSSSHVYCPQEEDEDDEEDAELDEDGVEDITPGAKKSGKKSGKVMHRCCTAGSMCMGATCGPAAACRPGSAAVCLRLCCWLCRHRRTRLKSRRSANSSELQCCLHRTWVYRAAAFFMLCSLLDGSLLNLCEQPLVSCLLWSAASFTCVCPDRAS